ncbi:MAG: hypothetical protein AAGF23_11635 [Acidobacteriota bacterium]
MQNLFYEPRNYTLLLTALFGLVFVLVGCGESRRISVEYKQSSVGPIENVYSEGDLTLSVLEVDSFARVEELVVFDIFSGFSPALTLEEATKRFGPPARSDLTENGDRYDRWGDDSLFVDLVTQVNISVDPPLVYYRLRSGSETQPVDGFVHPELLLLLRSHPDFPGRRFRITWPETEEASGGTQFLEILTGNNSFIVTWHS